MPHHRAAVDLDEEIQRAINAPHHPDRIALVEEHPDFPGCLHFDVGDDDNRQEFFKSYSKFVSRHLVLNELYQLDDFIAKITEDGWWPIFAPNTRLILEKHGQWMCPVKVDGYQLLDYQSFGINRALERAIKATGTNSDRFFFWNWSAGAGKSFCSGAGIKVLFELNEIDLAICATTSDLKINLFRFLQTSGLDVVLTDGDKDKRRRLYGGGHQVLVMNFEKFHFDLAELSEITAGRRVLFILDEAQKLINQGSQNRSRVGLHGLVRHCQATVWPMTATAVGASPLRYRDVFSLDGHPRNNVLGSKKEFEAYYAKKVKSRLVKSRSGGVFPLVEHTWDHARLQEIRHRVADRTMAMRRPSNMPTIPVMIAASDGQREAFEVITDKAREAAEKEFDVGPYYRLLRMVAVTPGALRVTEDKIAAEINAEFPHLAAAPAPKLAHLYEMLDEFRDQGDQAVCFVHWTTGGLHLMDPHLKGINYVKHWGSGQTRRQSQKAIDDFKANPGITGFLSSDAGALGLSFQNARYVINIDPVYDYDLMTQRNKRIDRADSYLEGLTSYVLITEDSVEERVWRVCNARMRLSAATQGTVEELTPEELKLADMPEAEMMRWSLFG
jgi:hypothetical protein